jgi:hypothetical protein
MADTTVYANGRAEVAVPAGEEIAVYSRAAVVINKIVGYPNVPSTEDNVTTTTAGEQYQSSGIATVATTVVILPGASDAFYEVGAAPSVGEPQTDISAADATFTITGLAAAQGGYTRIVGGASSTSANAGGAAEMLAGAPGLTGVGGAVNLTGAAGGATSGAGGAVNATGGAGTNGNSAGGAVLAVGGAGAGTGAGGAGAVTGGASGGGATGNGGDVTLTGGAASSTNGDGGSVILQGGALAGTGIDGGTFNRSTSQFRKQAAAVAKADGAQSVTGAQIINGICVHTVTTGATLTIPTGAAIVAACPADLATGDSFDFTVITIGTGADDISTLTAADGNVTFVGDVTVGPNLAGTGDDHGTWRFRYAGTSAWVGYRL